MLPWLRLLGLSLLKRNKQEVGSSSRRFDIYLSVVLSLFGVQLTGTNSFLTPVYFYVTSAVLF